MNIFRGYTDGLSATYQVATYQSGAGNRPAEPVSHGRAKPAVFTRALNNLTRLADKTLKRRGGRTAPSTLSAQLDLFARPTAS